MLYLKERHGWNALKILRYAKKSPLTFIIMYRGKSFCMTNFSIVLAF